MRFLLYSAILLLQLSAAPAAIIYYDVPPEEEFFWVQGTTPQTRGYDLDRNGTEDMHFTVGLGISAYASGIFGPPPITASILADHYGFFSQAVALLSAGYVIQRGPPESNTLGRVWQGGSDVLMVGATEEALYGPWVGKSGYLGFTFTDYRDPYPEYYGWMEVATLGEQGIYVRGWAWETTPHLPIVAGAIPEPGSAGLLVVSLAALGRRRQRTRPRERKGDI